MNAEAVSDVQKSNITAILAELKMHKKNELQNSEERIRKLIEESIASRYYYERGKVAVSLRNDKDVQTAAELLLDETEYKKILGF